MSETHRVFLIPGMFGFAQLAGYDYFSHVRRALEQRFADAGVEVITEDVPTPPTSSIRHRAAVLAKRVLQSGGDAGPIHLVGHSTGGLDARLALSPTTILGVDPETLEWTRRVRSVVTLNTPHFGTPLAGYFATVSGTRVLYALSLLTVLSLSVGEPHLAVFSRLLAGLGSVDQIFGGDLKLIRRATDAMLKVVDAEGRTEIHEFLSKVRTDQGAVIQIMPEAMDLFNAATEDNDAVRYGSVVAASPAPEALRFLKRVRSPYSAFTAAMYSTLYTFTSQAHKRYPYAELGPAQAAKLTAGLGGDIDDASNDGVVPTMSMVWGDLIWSGEADHLDVLGHFADDQKQSSHVDWLTSGADFSRRRFASLMDALAEFQLDAAPRGARP